ncbi:MAG: nitrile hydratase subunit alpha [Actinomycetota bacterium]|nr:nitrile hydratase subunit alpha [Actinomycetota bacterium]
MSGTHRDGEHDGHHHEGVKPRAEADYYAGRIRAIEELLVEKGVLTKEDVRRQIEYLDARSPANGARMVAHAWVDPEYKTLLLSDTKAAAAELGIDASGPVEFVTVENTPEVHNLIVCTLCSCYPRAILGRPPDWYKSFNYRSRAVVEPRAVMKEFGLEIPENVRVAVHDSSADVRYMVLPMRPPGTKGMNKEELTGLITRDALIGVSVPSEPVRTG